MTQTLVVPVSVKEALALAYELASENEELKRQLEELRMSGEYPEVLQSHHIMKLMGWAKSTLSQVANDPDFPHLDGGRQKGQSIRCWKSDFYQYMKNRKPISKAV